MQRIAERHILQQTVIQVLLSGEVIREYLDDRPFPIRLTSSRFTNLRQMYLKEILRQRENEVNSNLSNVRGNKEAGHTTFSVDLGDGLVVVRRVPATVCNQCGEEWISNETAQQLELVVEEARQKKHQIEVLSF